MESLLPTLNWSVSLGTILELLIVGTGVVTLFNRQDQSLSLLRKDVNYIQESQKALSEAFKQLGTILTSVAVQDTRLSMIEKRLDEVAHGKGLIMKEINDR